MEVLKTTDVMIVSLISMVCLFVHILFEKKASDLFLGMLGSNIAVLVFTLLYTLSFPNGINPLLIALCIISFLLMGCSIYLGLYAVIKAIDNKE